MTTNTIINGNLSYKDISIDLPVHKPSLGKDGLEVSHLGKEGIFSFDIGFFSTACCESSITFIDGEKGALLYRGYPIDQLATQSDYMEVCYLLMHGELPNTQKKTIFSCY